MSAVLDHLLTSREDAKNLNETTDFAAPVHQDRLFLIMWKSSRSGGTYSQLRKSVQGKNRFLFTLQMQGVNLDEVIVTEQFKAWIPQRKSKPAGNKRKYERKKAPTWTH